MAEHKEKIIHTLKIPIILLHTRTHASKNVCFLHGKQKWNEKKRKELDRSLPPPPHTERERASSECPSTHRNSLCWHQVWWAHRSLRHNTQYLNEIKQQQPKKWFKKWGNNDSQTHTHTTRIKQQAKKNYKNNEDEIMYIMRFQAVMYERKEEEEEKICKLECVCVCARARLA